MDFFFKSGFLVYVGCYNKDTIDGVAYNNRNWFLTRLGVQDKDIGEFCVFWGCFLVKRLSSHCVLDAGRSEGAPWSLIYGGIDPIQEAVPLWPNHLPNTPPPMNLVSIEELGGSAAFGL